MTIFIIPGATTKWSREEGPVSNPYLSSASVPILAFATGYMECVLSLYSLDDAVIIIIIIVVGCGSSGSVLFCALPIRTEELIPGLVNRAKLDIDKEQRLPIIKISHAVAGI